MHSKRDYPRAVRWLAALVLAGAGPLALLGSEGQSPEDNEYYVKAAFICQLVKFVDWPAAKPVDTNGVITIAIVGPNRFGKAFDVARTQQSKARPIQIKEFRLPQGPSTNDPAQQAEWNTVVKALRLCHLAYFTEMPKQDMRPWLAALVPGCVLTLGENDTFLDQGGMINVLPGRQKLVFEVNHSAVKASGIEISSKVLRLASRVVDK